MHGRIDRWVDCAGVGCSRRSITTAEEFMRVIDVNLMGQVHGAKVALPYLRERGGSLICVSRRSA
jgi:NAD(P)-dependent dehydrogenase (short-subunit alcohol dehydrogenase family)